MVLQQINPDTIGIKTSATSVQIKHDGTIKIGEKNLEGPGEYEIAGVGAHVVDTHALLFTEGVRLAVVYKTPMDTSEEETLTGDVYIFLVNDAKAIDSVVKDQDPRVAVLHNEAIAQELSTKEGVAVEPIASYKLTAQSLPADNREYILLG